MLRKERLEALSRPVLKIYFAIQTEILVNIAKRLGGQIDDDVMRWQLERFSELNGFMEENIDVIRKFLSLTRKEMDNLLKTAGFEGVEANEEILKKALAEGINLTKPPAPEESETILNILEAYQRKARNTLNLINSTMLAEAEQAYRDIVSKTAAEVLAGTKTSQQAIRDTVRAWSNKGIPALRDKAGKEWSAEAYVRMVNRTMSNQIAREMQEARFDEWGVDLVEISSHMGARPNCAPYQGQIYSRSGNSSQYPPLDSTSIGQPDGLFGINCSHVEYPYFPGVSTKRYSPYPQEANAEAYENSQIQRKFERNIRNAKTEKRMLEAVGDEEGVKIAEERIRVGQVKIRCFIAETGRTRRYGREQIYN